MFHYQRFFTTAAAAALVSTACIVAAVGPAKAADTAPLTVADWQATVDRQIDHELRTPQNAFGRADHAVANVAIRFDEQGGFDGARIATPSGDVAADREALRTARAIHYPVLPAGLRGKPRTIAMQLYFGDGSRSALQQADADHLAKLARGGVTAAGIRTASR